MPSDADALDLSFLSTDVRIQIEQARNIVKQAEVLRTTLDSVSDNEVRTKISDTIKELLDVAERINKNANTVYTSANTTFSPSTGFRMLKLKRDK